MAIYYLDENVPSSVRRSIEALGFDVKESRELLGQGAPDEVVATIAEQDGAILISHDRDFRKIKPAQPHVHGTRFRHLHIVRIHCDGNQSAERISRALHAIEAEFEYRNNRRDRGLIIDIKKKIVNILG